MRIIEGDCIAEMRAMAERGETVDAIVCDPPYLLEFMGKEFDRQHLALEGENVGQKMQAWHLRWAKLAYQLLPPGGHMIAFGGTRTYHRMVCAIEDAGFEIRDQLAWVYGTGFPKSHDVSKGIDRAAGAAREAVGERRKLQSYGANQVFGDGPDKGGVQIITAPATDAAREWQGWGTALKPAHEPILWAKKPLSVVPLDGILSETTDLIEALLWSIAPVRLVDACFELSQSASDVGRCGSARWIAAVLHGTKLLDASAMTDMFNSPGRASTFLSIAWLWNDILDESCSNQSTSITSTALSLTTGLRTLQCLISGITPESTTRAAIQTNGLWWNARTADASSSATPVSSGATPKHSVSENATWSIANGIANALANIAEASFHHLQVTSECSAKPLAIMRIEQREPALRPNVEPIVLARKPLIGTVAANVLAHGVGAINVEACRVDGGARPLIASRAETSKNIFGDGLNGSRAIGTTDIGRWPANLVHDGSDEVEAAFAEFGEKTSGGGNKNTGNRDNGRTIGNGLGRGVGAGIGGDTGSASRFFYSSKASKLDRAGSSHPTVKPISLISWLCRLVVPPGGAVLDPFAGSGTIFAAAHAEGFRAIGIEREAEYVADCQRRITALGSASHKPIRAASKATAASPSPANAPEPVIRDLFAAD